MLLIDFIFNTHIEEQFNAFKKGFFKIINEDIMEIFQPEELDLLICGSKTLDFSELESASSYVDGYTKESKIILWFWEIVHEDMND